MIANPLTNQLFVTAYFIVSGKRLQLLPSAASLGPDSPTTIPRGIELSLSLSEVESLFQAGPIQVASRVLSATSPHRLSSSTGM